MDSYAGSILSVDLTLGTIEKTPLTRELIMNYIGGQGINARLAYDLIRPGIDPMSPENVLIFGAGALVGTLAPTAARTNAMAKSPLSGFIGISNAADMGVMLKYAGYDHLIIKGKAKEPVLLKIEGDRIEIVGAKHLWGKDTIEATELLWQELGEEYSISCIGQAGENLVRYATIMNDKWNAFGRTGLGAVMGSKNLKAIAIYGEKEIKVAEPGRFMKLVNNAMQRLLQHPNLPVCRESGSWGMFLQGWEGNKAVGQFTQRTRRLDTELFKANALFENFKLGNRACLACPVGCKVWVELRKGKNKGLSMGVSCLAGTMNLPYGLSCAIPAFDDVAKTTELGQRFGLDSLNTAGVIVFAMELYEKGVITRDDTDGLEVGWSNTSAIQELMRKIALREGFGAVLADGVVEASKKIGKTSDLYVLHIKGMTLPLETSSDVRARINSTRFGFLVNPRGWHPDNFRYPAEGPGCTLETVKKYTRNIGAPEDRVDQIVKGDHYSVPLLAKYAAPFNLLVQSLGICNKGYIVNDSLDAELMTNLYCSATGINTTVNQLLQAGERIWNIERAFNIREGASRKDDTYPERVFREPFQSYLGLNPPLKRETMDLMLDEYYDAEGWDRTGKPTRKRLEELGLEDIAKDLGV